MLTIFKADSKQGVKMGLTKFHVHCIPCNWEIKDESFSGLFISSFFSLPFCCFPSKTPILFLEKTFLMSMPGGCLLYTWRCFRSVKFEEALCNPRRTVLGIFIFCEIKFSSRSFQSDSSFVVEVTLKHINIFQTHLALLLTFLLHIVWAKTYFRRIEWKNPLFLLLTRLINTYLPILFVLVSSENSEQQMPLGVPFLSSNRECRNFVWKLSKGNPLTDEKF